jgi:hypothetical protein
MLDARINASRLLVCTIHFPFFPGGLTDEAEQSLA